MTVPGPTIVEAGRELRAGSLRASELVSRSLQAIDRRNPETNAFIRVDADRARQEAAAADELFARGIDRGPLQGIPISLKDLIDVAGEVTTAASRVLADRRAASDATIVTRLRAAGAILIGKTNLHEFALGTTCEDSAFGPVRNPHDLTRSPGGSSGGSAVAVATGMGLASIGTDTGGSIRIPAAACGVVGLKATYGEVPVDGVIPLSTSFDHAGPLARSAEDAALLWAVLTARRPRPLETITPARLRVRRLTGYFDTPLAPEVRAPFEQALAALADAGVGVSEGELPSAREIMPHYVHCVLPEGAAWHARYLDERPDDYTPVVRDRFMSGRAITAVQYLNARAFCQALAREVDAALEGADALVLPTLPILAPRLGEQTVRIDPGLADVTPVRSAMLRQTQPFNMSGHPAISLPAAAPGLPVGLQIVGRRGETGRLLAIAAACEKIVGRCRSTRP